MFEVDLDNGPLGPGPQGQIAFELADMAFMGGSIWAASHGFDVDQEIACLDMQSLRTIRESVGKL